MGRLIIDGNSVFEIDENCLKRRKIPPKCNIEKYMRESKEVEKNKKKTKY